MNIIFIILMFSIPIYLIIRLGDIDFNIKKIILKNNKYRLVKMKDNYYRIQKLGTIGWNYYNNRVISQSKNITKMQKEYHIQINKHKNFCEKCLVRPSCTQLCEEQRLISNRLYLTLVKD